MLNYYGLSFFCQDYKRIMWDLIKKVGWFLWPVEKGERNKTFLMLMVLFLVSFVYSILRTLKLTILLAEPDLPTQAVSYLKIFGIMPAALLFTWMATRLQTYTGQEKTFLCMNLFFAGLFAFLTLVVMPHKELYRLGFEGSYELIILIDRWYISLFYVAAEMWSSIMLNMLCWGVIIEVTKLKESKRLYALFSLAGNTGTYAAGLWGSSTVKTQAEYIFGAVPTWEQSLLFQMAVLWGFQALIMIVFWGAMRSQHDEQQKILQKKVKVGFLEAIKIAWQNPIVRNISVMMVCFNIVYHIIDVVHNDYVRTLFAGTAGSMNSYLNLVSKYLGIFSIVFSWILSGSFVRVFGIPAALYFTPALWFALSGLDLMSNWGMVPNIGFSWEGLMVPVHILSLSLILSVGRAAKFTIFDTAKEMSLLSLSVQEKRLGKASIDGITTRLGKSGGAWMVISLTGIAGGVAGALQLLQGTIFLSYALWFISVFFLIKCLPREARGTSYEAEA